MRNEKSGISIAGNVLVDLVKDIDYYPAAGMLTNILRISRSAGGCVPNTAIDLAVIDPTNRPSAFGRIGNDENGKFVLEQLTSHGVDPAGICISQDIPTGFTDVMSVPSGERTFFHARGANAHFSPEDFPKNLDCRILHIGYILLLDLFDAADAEFGTVMARVLHDSQARGIKTSIDVVSASTADYPQKVLSALRYCNYCILNETECCLAFGLSPRNDSGALDLKTLRSAMELAAAAGVKEKVIVHCKETGLCLDVATGRFQQVPSLSLPSKLIKGSVGAGDAYCAGCLYGLYNGFADKELLEFASAAAACSLFAENAYDGMRSAEEIISLSKQYTRLPEVK